MPREKAFITLRRLEPGEVQASGDYWVEGYAPASSPGKWLRKVSPIPEGYEVCDLADATKVLIGETWIEKMSGAFTCGGLQLWPFRIEGLGVLAIRPIPEPEPEPEPMRGETQVYYFDVTRGYIEVPVNLIGKRIRWEVVKDGGE